MNIISPISNLSQMSDLLCTSSLPPLLMLIASSTILVFCRLPPSPVHSMWYIFCTIRTSVSAHAYSVTPRQLRYPISYKIWSRCSCSSGVGISGTDMSDVLPGLMFMILLLIYQYLLANHGSKSYSIVWIVSSGYMSFDLSLIDDSTDMKRDRKSSL